jgi:glycine oxidase
MMHVIVVGGGIAGCAAAIELASRRVAVTLLEAEQPGVRTTGASGGMLAPQYEAGGPNPAFGLGIAARDAYPSFVRRIEELSEWRVGYRRDGMLVANRTAEEEAAAGTAAAWQVALGLRSEILTAGDARTLHAGISREISSWQWLPDEAQVDAQRLAVAIGPAAQAVGVAVRNGQTVTAVLTAAGRVAGVRTAAGDVLSADCVVLAAGAWSASIAGLPRHLPVAPVRGQILRLRPQVMPGWPLVATHTAHYLVPRENGTVLVGSTMESDGFDDSVTDEARLLLATDAAALVPALADAPVVERWAGLRPLTPDRWPIVGPEPELPGLYYATGHGRNGILLGPLTGRVTADLAVDGNSAIAWQPLRVERFDNE